MLHTHICLSTSTVFVCPVNPSVLMILRALASGPSLPVVRRADRTKKISNRNRRNWQHRHWHSRGSAGNDHSPVVTDAIRACAGT